MINHHFISYSSVDGLEFAKSLSQQFSSMVLPLPTWLDKTHMRPGQDWDDQIDEAIQDCRTLLLVLTGDSARSPQCKLEWSMALRYKKPVLVLRFDSDAQAPTRLQDHHYIDFTHDAKVGTAKLADHLIWLDSPAGELQSLKIRLADARRALPRAEDESRRRRIADEIQDLERKIEAQSILVRDPAAAEKRVESSIQARVQLERRPQTEVAGKRSVFINPPPGTAPNYFQDRHEESKLTGDFLADDTRCLFTIVGRGGVGKTALVCRLLKHLERGQRPDGASPMDVDGIVYLSNQGTRRITASNIFADVCQLLPDDKRAAIDQLVKNPQASTEAKTQALLAAFPSGRTVLLLDNFEDSLDPDTRRVADHELREVLETILRTSGHALKVIVTSRMMPADVALIVPGRQGRIYLDEGLESPYAENILREMDTDGHLGLKAASAELLADARARTRGFPKALEALVAILSADRNASIEDVLSRAGRALPEEVVQVLVGEAFNRLDTPAQKVMQALAAYARPVPTVAVDYMLQPHVHGVDAAPILARLANMQFVRKEQSRYYLHPVDREYALGKVPLGTRDDSDENFTRNSLWRRGAEYLQQARLPRDSWKRLEDLEPQLAEFELRVSCGDFDSAAVVLSGIDISYLYRWGQYRLIVSLHEQLAGKISDRYIEQVCAGSLGETYSVIGQIPRAVDVLEHALDLARELHNLEGEAVQLNNLANCYQDMGQSAKARDCHERALTLKRRAGPSPSDRYNIVGLGSCLGDLGDPERALALHEEGLALSRQAKDQNTDALILSNVCIALNDLGRYDEAIRRAREGLTLAEATGNPMAAAYLQYSVALGGLFANRLAEGRKAAAASAQFDVPELKDRSLVVLGIVARRQGDVTAATEAFRSALAIAEENLKVCPAAVLSMEAKGLALAGLAIEEPAFAHQSVETFRAARALTTDAGLVARVVRQMKALMAGSPELLADALRAAGG